MTNYKTLNRPYLDTMGKDKNVNSQDTFREIGKEVAAWLEAKKPKFA